MRLYRRQLKTGSPIISRAKSHRIETGILCAFLYKPQLKEHKAELTDARPLLYVVYDDNIDVHGINMNYLNNMELFKFKRIVEDFKPRQKYDGKGLYHYLKLGYPQILKAYRVYKKKTIYSLTEFKFESIL